MRTSVAVLHHVADQSRPVVRPCIERLRRRPWRLGAWIAGGVLVALLLAGCARNVPADQGQPPARPGAFEAVWTAIKPSLAGLASAAIGALVAWYLQPDDEPPLVATPTPGEEP